VTIVVSTMNYSIGVVRGDGGVPQGAAGLGDVGRGRVQDQLPLQNCSITYYIDVY